MKPESDLFLEWGVDYVTGTTVKRRGSSALAEFGSFVVTEEATKGNNRDVWKFSEYRGHRAGKAAYGRRHDGEICQLSGKVAAEYWAQVLHLSHNISRLDIQVTVLPVNGPTNRLRQHYNQIRRRRNGMGRPPRYKYIGGPTGLESILLGSRASDRFGRIYDKEKESGKDYYKGALRYEIELKRKAAIATAVELDQSEDDLAFIAATIYKFALVRNIQVAWDLEKCSLANRSPVRVGTGSPHEDSLLYRRAQWAQNCLRPTVEMFIRHKKLPYLLTALGLDEHVYLRPDLSIGTRSDLETEVVN